MQQSSAIPKNQGVGRGLRKIVACSHCTPPRSVFLFQQFWHGVISTSLMIFTLVDITRASICCHNLGGVVFSGIYNYNTIKGSLTSQSTIHINGCNHQPSFQKNNIVYIEQTEPRYTHAYTHKKEAYKSRLCQVQASHR